MRGKPLQMGMKPGHPGSFVRHDILEHHGLTIAQAVEAPGVLSDLVNERSGLSPEMALRLEKVFGVGMDMMLRIQAAWDAYMTRIRFKQTAFKSFTPAV